MSPRPSARIATRARGRRRGFTLIELTVALVAGLLVAMSVATLSHEATATFNEEVRISAAEATLRTAADRLRADLQRAAYMSTPNIEMDPSVARPFGQATPFLANPTQVLQSILYTPGTSTVNGAALVLDAKNGISPASVDISGNLSSVDAFEVQTKNQVGACCQVLLAASSPSIYRLLNANGAGVPDPNADAELQNIFAPAPPVGTAAVTNAQFWVRYTDTVTGKSEYILTCSAATANRIAGVITTGTTVQPYVFLDRCPLTGAQTQQTITNGNTGGTATVNPVVTARWQIVAPGAAAANGGPPAQDIAALDNSPMVAGADPNKYDLVRSLVDGNGNLLAQTTEIIAEYAVGLDLAFTVDNQAGTSGANPALQAYDFADPLNTANAASVSTLLNAPVGGGGGSKDPQRIRAVKFMIQTRAAIPDRTASIPVATGAGSGTFLYRYCMNPAGCAGNALQWARVRTIVSEVALTNQQQSFF
ncbi:MAG: PilW family protein [Polyangiaceae bacterium]